MVGMRLLTSPRPSNIRNQGINKERIRNQARRNKGDKAAVAGTRRRDPEVQDPGRSKSSCA